MPAIQNIQSGSITPETTTHTINAPTGLVADDLWVIHLHIRRNDGRTVTNLPAGWTVEYSVKDTVSVTNGILYVLSKKSTGSETSVDIEITNSTRSAWGSFRVTDYDVNNPFNNNEAYSSEDVNTGDVPFSGINSVNGNLLVATVGLSGAGGTLSWTSTDGMSAAFYDVQETGSAGAANFAFEEDILSTGSTGTITLGSDRGDAYLGILYDINAVSSDISTNPILVDGVAQEGIFVEFIAYDATNKTGRTVLQTVSTDINGVATLTENVPAGKVLFIRCSYPDGSTVWGAEQFFTDNY